MTKTNANISAEILYPLFGKTWKEEKIPQQWEKKLLVILQCNKDLVDWL
jgi:hypothetical protein